MKLRVLVSTVYASVTFSTQKGPRRCCQTCGLKHWATVQAPPSKASYHSTRMICRRGAISLTLQCEEILLRKLQISHASEATIPYVRSLSSCAKVDDSFWPWRMHGSTVSKKGRNWDTQLLDITLRTLHQLLTRFAWITLPPAGTGTWRCNLWTVWYFQLRY